jgi:hypothetical protein
LQTPVQRWTRAPQEAECELYSVIDAVVLDE